MYLDKYYKNKFENYLINNENNFNIYKNDFAINSINCNNKENKILSKKEQNKSKFNTSNTISNSFKKNKVNNKDSARSTLSSKQKVKEKKCYKTQNLNKGNNNIKKKENDKKEKMEESKCCIVL